MCMLIAWWYLVRSRGCISAWQLEHIPQIHFFQGHLVHMELYICISAWQLEHIPQIHFLEYL